MSQYSKQKASVTQAPQNQHFIGVPSTFPRGNTGVTLPGWHTGLETNICFCKSSNIFQCLQRKVIVSVLFCMQKDRVRESNWFLPTVPVLEKMSSSC